MRITGGHYTGRRLEMPKGPEVRPTLDHVRQALFNLIGAKISGARVLDLFSGTGAFGIEALSRGAAEATFVDRSFFCAQTIKANLERVGIPIVGPSPAIVFRTDSPTVVRRFEREGTSFDIVFIDPPYGGDLARKSLNAIADHAIVPTHGLVIAEHDKRSALPDDLIGTRAKLVVSRRERYGDTSLTFYLCETLG